METTSTVHLPIIIFISILISMSGYVGYKLHCCGLLWRRPIHGVTRQGRQCVMVLGGRSGWMSGKVRRYEVDCFGLPWWNGLIQQYPAGFPWAAVLRGQEGDDALKTSIVQRQL